MGRCCSPSLVSWFENEPNKIHLLLGSKDSGKNKLCFLFSALENSQDLDLAHDYQS